MRGFTRVLLLIAIVCMVISDMQSAEASGRRRPVANALSNLAFGRPTNVFINGGHGGHSGAFRVNGFHNNAFRGNAFHGNGFNGFGFHQPRAAFVPFGAFGGFNQPVLVPLNEFGHPVHGSSTFFFRSGF